MTHVCMSTGWTYEYVGYELDLPKLASLNKYWRKFPPVHLLIAAYLGYEEKPEASKQTEMSVEELMKTIPMAAFQPPKV